MLEKNYAGPMRIAHRGVVQAAPENTIGAFGAAADSGLEGIEIDVKLSKDGQVVVVHDSNLTRLTLGHPTQFRNDRIAELDWEALSKIEMPYANHLLDDDPPTGVENEFLAILPGRLLGQENGRDYQSALVADSRMARLMRLEEFMGWMEATPGILAEIEIKAPGAVRPILQIIDKSPASNRCILFSGVESYIEEIQRECALLGKPKGLKLGANIRRLTAQNKRQITQMDLFEVGLNAECFDREDISWLADQGIAVFSNLGDYPAWWEKICELQIAGFKTNYAKAFTIWVGGLDVSKSRFTAYDILKKILFLF